MSWLRAMICSGSSCRDVYKRQDLNDVDRAAALLRLRKLMQEEIDATPADQRVAGTTWGGKVTWAKVGGRLGYSRQRIHQLIQLLDLPDEIKDAVREGELSERDTRIYQGLTAPQQRALHRARMAGDLAAGDVRPIARLLRESPEMTVAAATRLLAATAEDDRPTTTDDSSAPLPPRSPAPLPDDESSSRGTTTIPDPLRPARVGAPTSIERPDWVRGHLARVDRQGLTAAERKELLRLLKLIKEDVTSLMAALAESRPSTDDRDF